MLKSHLKRAIKPILKAVNLYPFLPRALEEEAAFWKSTLPDWADLLKRDGSLWKSARAAAKNGPRVLIATSVGGFSPNSLIDSLLAVALTLRGAEVHNLLCDEALPACIMSRIRYYGETERYVKKGPTKLTCGKCFRPGYEMFRPLGLPTHRLGQLIAPQEAQHARELSSRLEADQLSNYNLDGLAIGEQAIAGALRFYMAGDLADEPHGEAVLRHYCHAALRTAYAARRLLKTHDFASVCMLHGIYVPHGVILEVAREQKVRSINWSRTYRNKSFIFSHDDTYHHTMLSEPMADWENLDWTPVLEEEVLNYLKSRWYGSRDWITYHENSHEDVASIATEMGIDFSKPRIGMLTNVMGDAQVLYPSNAFPSMLEWVLQTIRYFAQRPDLQLIIRVHPAEIRGTDRSRQPLVNEIKRAFPVVPDNVFVVPPEHPINTYPLMLKCDSVIIYSTKTGVELTSYGIPVVVAGDAWVRNKGITLDASTPEEYFRLLDRLPLGQRLSEAAIQRARKFAYHFFFRRMIPLPYLEPVPPAYKLAVSGLEQLLPGRSVGLDVVCDGILNGAKFIYPAELHSEIFSDR